LGGFLGKEEPSIYEELDDTQLVPVDDADADTSLGMQEAVPSRTSAKLDDSSRTQNFAMMGMKRSS